MEIDLSVIKEESIIKLEKSLKKVKNNFLSMLSISLNTISPNIGNQKYDEINYKLDEMIEDELKKYAISFAGCMNKCSSIIVNELKNI